MSMRPRMYLICARSARNSERRPSEYSAPAAAWYWPLRARSRARWSCEDVFAVLDAALAAGFAEGRAFFAAGFAFTAVFAAAGFAVLRLVCAEAPGPASEAINRTRARFFIGISPPGRT